MVHLFGSSPRQSSFIVPFFPRSQVVRGSSKTLDMEWPDTKFRRILYISKTNAQFSRASK